MKCVVGLDCVSYIAVHFCLNIRQLTELWIWDLVANGWPLFRCAFLFMFVVRRDSWASNPSLWNASRAWSWLSKKRSEARPSCSVRHVERNCITLFFLSGACIRTFPILSVGMVQTDRSCRARSVLHVAWARWQQVVIAGRGRYDSPEYCGTQVGKRSTPDQPAPRLSEFVTLSPLNFCCMSVLSNSVFVTVMRYLLGTW